MKNSSTGFRERRLPGPVLWYGGKSNHMLPKIIGMLPITDIYVEPYGGAGSVLFTKVPSRIEIYNDLDVRLTNLLAVIQDDDMFPELYHRVFFTIYSFEEFKKALDISKFVNASSSEDQCFAGPFWRGDGEVKFDQLTVAWAFFVAQNQGYGGISKSYGNWGRAFTHDKGVAKKVRTYKLRVDRLPRQHERLRGVEILREDAIGLVEEFDSPDTTFYLDPPYLPDSRVNKVVYSHDQNLGHHEMLVKRLLDTQSAVVLSGYENPVYYPLQDAGWERIDLKSYASSAARNRGIKTVGTGSLLKHASRVEVIWRSPRAVELLPIGG